MIRNLTTRIYSISAAICPKKIEEAMNYIAESINDFYSKSENLKNPISVRILFGGDNKDWNGTSLQCFYDYYKNKYKDSYKKDIKKYAARDVGRMLKRVLHDDTRSFELCGKDSGNKYRMV